MHLVELHAVGDDEIDLLVLMPERRGRVMDRGGLAALQRLEIAETMAWIACMNDYVRMSTEMQSEDLLKKERSILRKTGNFL